MTEKPSILHDPATGRPILMAPRRQKRTIHTAAEASSSTCPFCTGNEGQTPEELTAVRPPDTEPGSPGWSVRAFANLYPAAAFHEVDGEWRNKLPMNVHQPVSPPSEAGGKG